MMADIKLSASMMCVNMLEMKRDLDLFLEYGVDYLHIDIMDGHYVPNFTLGQDFCKILDGYSPIPLDIHLMIENVDSYVPMFAGFKSCIVCIHPEVAYHPIRTLQSIRRCGARAGVAIDPAMPPEHIYPMLPFVDMVCVMTVNPGYSGQKLIPGTLEKMASLAGYIGDNHPEIEIEVDGNVSWENIPKMVEAGARTLVLGSSSLFEKARPLRENLQRLRGMLSGKDMRE